MVMAADPTFVASSPWLLERAFSAQRALSDKEPLAQKEPSADKEPPADIERGGVDLVPGYGLAGYITSTAQV